MTNPIVSISVETADVLGCVAIVLEVVDVFAAPDCRPAAKQLIPAAINTHTLITVNNLFIFITKPPFYYIILTTIPTSQKGRSQGGLLLEWEK